MLPRMVRNFSSVHFSGFLDSFLTRTSHPIRDKSNFTPFRKLEKKGSDIVAQNNPNFGEIQILYLKQASSVRSTSNAKRISGIEQQKVMICYLE